MYGLHLAPCFLPACLDYHSTLNMEAVRFFETSLNVSQHTLDNPEDGVLYSQRRQQFRLHSASTVWMIENSELKITWKEACNLRGKLTRMKILSQDRFQRGMTMVYNTQNC
jgi:hypothetical protein